MKDNQYILIRYDGIFKKARQQYPVYHDRSYVCTHNENKNEY